MSRLERSFCRGSLWRRSASGIAGSLPTERMGKDVLEIGCGSGDIAEQLSRAIPDASITATDLDPVMVRSAARRLAGRPGAAVVTADATDLPFGDDAFDSVVSCLMLHHVIGWETAVAEIARVLRPGGVFTGYDLVRTPLATLVHRIDRSPFRLVNPDELAAVAGRHGLELHTATALGGHAMRFTSR